MENYNCKVLFNILKETHLFYHNNGRTSMTLFSNENEIIKSIDETRN